MQRRHRFFVLAREYLDHMGEQPSVADRLDCLDCVSATPTRVIPRHQSLLWFVDNFLKYFFGEKNGFHLSHPGAAAYVRGWKLRWLPHEE